MGNSPTITHHFPHSPHEISRFDRRYGRADDKRMTDEKADGNPKRQGTRTPKGGKITAGSEPSRARRSSGKGITKGYKYDWQNLREQFIEGVEVEGKKEKEFLNLVQIAERNGVPIQRVRERAADERWYDQREQYQLRVAKQRQTKRVLELAGQSVEFDSNALDTAKLGMHAVTTRVQEIANEIEVAREQSEPVSSVVDARELETLARAATAWQTLGHKAMGTDVTRMEIQHDIQANIDVDVEVTSISAELSRDDPERLAAFLQAAKRAGLLDTVIEPGSERSEDDGELIEEVTTPLEIEAANDDIIDAEILD